MYKLLRNYFSIILVSCFLISCDEDVQLLDETELSTVDPLIDANRDAISDQVAFNLASNMGSSDLRRFIKKQASKQFDGDDNFLIALTLDNNISSNSGRESTRFADFISSNANTSGRASEAATVDLESLTSNHPLTQVAVYVPNDGSLDEWDEENFVPLVAYVPSGTAPGEIPAYNQDGQQITLSVDNAPDEVVVVISQNERVIEIERGTFGNGRVACSGPIPLMSDDTYDYFIKEDYYNSLADCGGGGSGGSGGTGGGSSSGCDRDSNSSKDYLHQMKFNSSSVYKDAKDGWFNNDLEIRVDILFASQNGAINHLVKYFNKSQSTMKSLNWTGITSEIVTWDKSSWGDAMKYSWREDDGDGTRTTTFTWTSKYDDNNTVTHSASVTTPKNSYPLGESIVEYCDVTSGDGFTYNTGRMQFRVNQQ